MSRRPRASGAKKAIWIGGQVSLPTYVAEPEAYRPELLLWLDPLEGIVAHELVDPRTPTITLGDLLRQATQKPMVGKPRRPASVRVSDPGLAAKLRQELGRAVVVTEGPTPEIDECVKLMSEWLSSVAGSGLAPHGGYVEGDGLDADLVGELFAAAHALYVVAPWKVMDDSTLVRVDIDALDVEGACLCVIGALGESFGLLIFPSALAWEAFRDAAEAREMAGGGRPSGPTFDVGTDFVSLNFDPLAEVPPLMRKEAAKYGWPLAGPDAYPLVARCDRDGIPMPLTERDMRIATACASAFATFFLTHKDRIVGFEPTAVTIEGDDGVAVRLTVPYEAEALFEAETHGTTSEPLRSEQIASGAKELGALGGAAAPVRRNDPCPCGSGKKYKKCCMHKDKEAASAAGSAAEPSPSARVSPAHELDRRVIAELTRWGRTRFARELRKALKVIPEQPGVGGLCVPWAMYGHQFDGQTVAERYLAEKGTRLSGREREWLSAQIQSWLGVWEVQQVEPGRSLTVQDLLSGEVRSVHDTAASQTLVKRDVLLGRVVDYLGESVLCGNHPRPLPPSEAGAVLERARRRLRCRREVPVERLRDGKFGKALISYWEDAVAQLNERRDRPPQLCNTDGDELLWTVDHYGFEPARRDEIAQRLASLKPYEVVNEEDGRLVFLREGNPQHKHWDNTVVGSVTFGRPGKLRVETNSVKRADTLRADLERALRGRVRHAGRTHSDPHALVGGAGTAGDGPLPEPESPPPEALAAVREYKAQHYAAWMDQPLPALGGISPRQARRTRKGKEALDVLLKEMENHEARGDPAAAFDFAPMRRELGL